MKIYTYQIEVRNGRKCEFSVNACNRLNAFRMALSHPEGAGNSFSVPAGVYTLGDFSKCGVIAVSKGKFSHNA